MKIRKFASALLACACLLLPVQAMAAGPEGPGMDMEETSREVLSQNLKIQILDASPTVLSVEYRLLSDSGTWTPMMTGAYTLDQKTEDGWQAMDPLPREFYHEEMDMGYELETGGCNSSQVDFRDQYGVLSPGTYRIHWHLLKEAEPETFVFKVAGSEKSQEQKAARQITSGIQSVLRDNHFCVRVSSIQKNSGRQDLSFTDSYYCRSGNNVLELYSDGKNLKPGLTSAMYLNGETYVYDESWERSGDPVFGYSEFWIPEFSSFEEAQFTEISDHQIRYTDKRYDMPDYAYDQDVPTPQTDWKFLFDDEGGLIRIDYIFQNYVTDTLDPSGYSVIEFHKIIDVLPPELADDMIEFQKIS